MSKEIKIRLSDDDLAMLGSFVKSPVFSAFKRLIDQHVAQCQGMLITVDDHTALIRLQGRVQGLNTLSTLPVLIVTEKEQKDKRAAENENVEDKVLRKHQDDHVKFSEEMAKKRADKALFR